MHGNTWKRKALTVLSVPLLAVPSAMGVYGWLTPESGHEAALSAAIGFEALYIGVNVLVLSSPELRRYARNVSLAAVATAITFNTLYHYGLKVDGAFTGAGFAPLAFILSLIMAVPLAGLAYAVSVLLHRLSEEGAPTPAEREGGNTPAPVTMPLAASWPRESAYPEPVPHIAPIAAQEPAQTGTRANENGVPGNSGNGAGNAGNGNGAARVYRCKHCSAEGLTKAEQLTHGRRHAKERQGVN